MRMLGSGSRFLDLDAIDLTEHNKHPKQVNGYTSRSRNNDQTELFALQTFWMLSGMYFVETFFV